MAQPCAAGLSSTNGDENCPPEIAITGIFSSNISGWTSFPTDGINYLSCLDCLQPEFNYTGAPITDCSGQEFTFFLSTDCSPDVFTTFTLYPAPSGTMDLACNGDAATLTFVPDLICANYSYQWKDAAGNPVTGSGTTFTVDPADDQLYSIMVMNNDLPASCSPFVISEVASCCTLDVDCSALENITVQCDNDPLPAPTPALVSVLGACGNTTITTNDVTIAAGNGCASDPTVIERIYTVTDDNGTPGDSSDDTTVDCTQTITIGDSEGPEITHAPTDLTVEYGDDVEDSFEAWLNYHAYADASDDCGGDLMWLINTPDPAIQYGCACTGSGTVLFSAVDQCGNATDFTAVFYVEDTTAPVIEEDANNETIQCAGDDYSAAFQAWLNSHGGATASDDCDVIWTTDPPNPQLEDGCGNTSNTVVTFVASDDCGNFATTTGRFRVVDTEVPQWTSIPQDITIGCDDEIVFDTPVATDLCSEPVIDYVDVETPGSYCDGSYTITRTWTARDGCQWEATEISQTITLIDDEGPSITAVHPLLIGLSDYDTLTFECDNMTVFSPSDFTAVDNCDPDPQMCMVDPVISSIGCEDGVSVQMLCTWIGKDVCGNNTDFNVIINIVDTTPPVISDVPVDQTIECGEDPDFDDNPPTAEDNCDDDLEITYVDTESNVGCDFTYTRTWTFTDDCGNFATATQNFHFTDNTLPEFTFVPDDQTISCTDSVAFGDAIATDDCTDVMIMIQDMTGSGTCLTSHTRVWTATDGCGNTATASQTITAVDDVAPTFTFVPEDETVACGDDILFGTPMAMDNCSNVDLTFEQQITGSGSCITSYVRTWTATDACGLTATASQTIMAVDDIAPTFTFVPADETIDCGETAVFGTPEVIDNCSDIVLTFVEETTGSGSCITSYVGTWTATDGCGLSTTATQTISVSENVAPVFTFVPQNSILECGEIATFGTPTVSDSCGEVTLVSSDMSMVDGCTETFTRIWTATDACGLSSTAAQTLSRTDDGMPAFAAIPSDITMSCGAIPQFDNPQVSGTCGDVDVTFADMEIANDNCETSYVRTWTATSVCGMTATAVQAIVTVDDNAPAFVNFPDDVTIDCEETPVFSSPSYSDLCSTDVSLTFVDEFSSTGCGFTHIRTWTLEDDCGNMTSATQTITTIDNTAPAFDFVPDNLMLGCGETGMFGEAIASDNCGNVTLTFEDYDQGGSLYWGFDITRTWTATDECGNTATASQNMWIDGDQTAPVFTAVPAAQVFDCDDLIIIGEATAEDDCSDAANLTLTFVDEQTGDDCTAGYEIISTWTVTDEAGNTATASVTIVVVGPTALEFAYIPADRVDACDEVADFGMPITNTKCSGGATMTYEDEMIEGDCNSSYQLTRTWTASDACGGLATCAQTITVQDVEAPVFAQIPEDATVSCVDAALFGTPIAADNCSSSVEVTFEDNTIVNGCTETRTRTWTAVDECGNVKVAAQNITIADLEAPVFTQIPEDQFLTCGEAAEFGTPTVTDNCNSNVALTFEDNTTVNGCTETRTRTWTAADACGNAKLATQTITVVTDLDAPVFTQVPEDQFLTCGDAAAEFGTPTVADNCSNDVNLTFEDNTTVDGCTEIRTRTWTAADACGNAKLATQTITLVTDLAAPVFTQVPEDQVLTCGEAAQFGTPMVADNCSSDVALTFEDNTTVNGCTEIMTRTWTAADACGNVKLATQTITRMDQLTPEFVFVPADQTLACGETPDYVAAEATDDCSNVTVTYEDIESGVDCAESKTILRRWTATDACGNVAIASQTITMPQDVTAPVFSFVPQDMNINCGETMPEMAAVADDNCSDVNLVYNLEIIEAACSKQYIRSWTATDACGNATQATQVITETDNEAPAFVAVANNQSVLCGEAIEFATPEFTDNCGTATITFADETTAGNCENGQSYDVTRTWTLMDACGNTVSASQTITVLPASTAIAFTDVPSSLSLSCGQTVAFGTPQYFSNCFGNVSLTHNDEVITEGCMEVHTRTWTATDACNNAILASQTITVVDDVAPIYADNLSDYAVTCNESIVFGTAQASDNCGAVNLSYEDSEMIVGCNTVYTRTWIAIDACGNESYKNQNITLEDNVAPQFMDLVETSTITCEENVDFVSMNAIDDCSEVTVAFEDNVTTSGCVTTHTRSWTATDACGNVAVAQQVINVEDREAPVFLTTLDQAVVNCGESVEFTTPEVADNCSSAALTFEDIVLADDCDEIHTRTWTAVDGCGNVAQTQQVIRVEDTSAPVFSNLIAEGTAECGEIINFTPPSITDNCSMMDITFADEIVETPGCATVHARIWTATDACGNVSTAQQFISVQDNMAPVLTYVPTDEVLACGEDVAFDTPEFSDNCSEVSLDFVDADIAGTTPGEYQRVRTWTASDACGNQTTAAQTFTILDDEAPAIAVLSNTTFVFPVEEFDRNWEPGFYAIDDCSSVDVVGPVITKESVCNGINYTYTYTATDLAGNTVSHTYLVNVVMNDCDDNAVDQPAGIGLDELPIEGTQSIVISDFIIAPNPVTDLMVVRFSSDTNNVDVEITLFNALGQREHTYQHTAVTGLNKLPVRVDHLPKGNYYVRLKAGDTIMTQQVMITP